MFEQLQFYLGDRPDLSHDYPTGKTETYIPGNDKHVELTVDHILAAEAILEIASEGGLSENGNYVPTLFDVDEFTRQQHHERVIAQQHIEAQQK